MCYFRSLVPISDEMLATSRNFNFCQKTKCKCIWFEQTERAVKVRSKKLSMRVQELVHKFDVSHRRSVLDGQAIVVPAPGGVPDRGK